MNSRFSVNDGSVLYGILADIAGDIILKTDIAGFIEHASPDLTGLGVDLDEFLIAPHIADLADPSHRASLSVYFDDARCGNAGRDRIEFPLSPRLSVASEIEPIARCGRRWFTLRLRPIPNGHDGSGMLGLLRVVEPRHSPDRYWSSTERVDRLTGIANRCAFTEALAENLETAAGGVMALLEIDAFRALCLRLGQGAGDAMIRAFADFLGVVLQEGEVIARIDGHKFALLMPECGPDDALARASDIIATFAELSQSVDMVDEPISVSVGLARLTRTQQETLRRAERALILAGAAGGARAELFEMCPSYLTKTRGTGSSSLPGFD